MPDGIETLNEGLTGGEKHGNPDELGQNTQPQDASNSEVDGDRNSDESLSQEAETKASDLDGLSIFESNMVELAIKEAREADGKESDSEIKARILAEIRGVDVEVERVADEMTESLTSTGGATSREKAALRDSFLNRAKTGGSPAERGGGEGAPVEETVGEYMMRRAMERAMEGITQEKQERNRRGKMLLDSLGIHEDEEVRVLLENMQETDRALGGEIMRHNSEYMEKDLNMGITIAPHEFMDQISKGVNWFDQPQEVLDYLSKHPDLKVRYDAASKFEFAEEDRLQLADEVNNLSQDEFDQLSFTEKHQLMRVWWQQSRVVLLGYDDQPRPEMDDVKQHLEQLFGLDDLGDREYYASLLEKVEQEKQT